MTLLGPLLFAGVYIVLPALLIGSEDDAKKILVLDKSGLFENRLKSSEDVSFTFAKEKLEVAKARLKKENYDAILFIPESVLEQPQSIALYFEKQLSVNAVDYIERSIQKRIEADKLIASGVDQKILDSVKTPISISTLKMTEQGDENSSSGLVTVIGYVGGLLIYLFIFLFGTQVMRGVIEEKTSRIVEVIISSVKPFELMMGKIVGIAMVGLTQFLLWIILFAAVTTAGTTYLLHGKSMKPASTIGMSENAPQKKMSDQVSKMKDIYSAFDTVNVVQIILVFLFYFLGGYLFYGSWFAAIGSAVDSDTDVQQFMLPVTIPLIFAFVMAQFVLQNPDGPVAFWCSVIPFTSPIIMMVRIPFGVPAHELIISMLTLVVGFMCTTWIAARIYRTGILMYGKKPTYRELAKWLFYKG